MTIAEICRACPHFQKNIALCEFYIRRCSTEKLWKGILPPPRECPKKEELITLGALEET